MAYVIEEAHKQDIKVHAWFNPYRVTTTKPVDMTKEEYLNNNLHPKNFAVIKNAMTYVTENYWTIHVLQPVVKTLSDNLNDQLLPPKEINLVGNLVAGDKVTLRWYNPAYTNEKTVNYYINYLNNNGVLI